MLITVTGKQMDVGDSLRGHVDAVTRAIVEKYFGRAIEAHVVFYHEGHLISSDVSVHAGRGLLVQCHGASRTPMPLSTVRRTGSTSGCAATSGGSAITIRARERPAMARRRQPTMSWRRPMTRLRMTPLAISLWSLPRCAQAFRVSASARR